MLNVTFINEKKSAAVKAGTLLLDAARNAGVSTELPCGGKGVCGKCLVKIEAGGVDFKNNGVVPKELVKQGYVPICLAAVKDTDVSVLTLSDLKGEAGKFTDAYGDYLRIDNALIPSEKDIEFLVKKVKLTVAPPETADGLSDLDRLKQAVSTALKCGGIHVPLSVLTKLPSALRADKGSIVLYYGGVGVVDIAPSNAAYETYGVAVDIGTTTVAVTLIDERGNAINAKTAYNKQIECGLDIISRINYARKNGGLAELKRKVLATVNELIDGLAKKYKISKEQITNISIAANTTMVHLLLGIDPEYIRLEPYAPAVYNAPLYTAKEIGLEIHPGAPVDIAPSVGSYVGGDITAGLLCTSLAAGSDEVCLFIDIGTNGEIVLGNNGFMLGCACSAGPAFEGGGIGCGMRASAGAIEKVEIDKETKAVRCFTIGNKPPTGICGSGMISLIAGMFKTGLIDAAGKLDRNAQNVAVNGRTASITIAKGNKNKDIVITEADIDNIVRAKAAIFSACRTLLKKADMDFGGISKIYIAGGFGRYLDIADAETIGLIPNLPHEKYVFLGNTALSGARMCLVSKRHRELRGESAAKITYIDLGAEAGYIDEYTAALFLPHTDAALFKAGRK